MPPKREPCICDGPLYPDGEPVNVTVGCRVHHLMADGAPAADHEVRCMCGNFADDRDCKVFISLEDNEGDLFHVCGECQPWAQEQEHLRVFPMADTFDPAPDTEWQRAADELEWGAEVVTEWGVKYTQSQVGSWVSPRDSEEEAREDAAAPAGTTATKAVVARRVVYGGWQERE